MSLRSVRKAREVVFFQGCYRLDCSGGMMRILVVEDEPTNQEVATVILRTGGHDVEIAGNGQEALARLSATDESFDLVLMDLLMPVMDGFAATKLIRSRSELRDVPILACSAKASKKDREEALASGCNHFITKPFRRSDLLQAIEKTMGLVSPRRIAPPSQSW